MPWAVNEAREIAMNASFPGVPQSDARLLALVARLANVVAEIAEELAAVEAVINEQGRP
jgi:hypothetical protein